MSRRVAVVGATFGAHYAKALQRSDSPVTLDCVVGVGGRHSRALAADCDVPLRTLDELTPDQVDAAVVAVRSQIVGGAGDEIARILLGRRIEVLQELPVHPDDLITSLRAARAGGARFRVNPFYTHLDAVRALVADTAALRTEAPVHHVLVRTCTQTLHASLFVLADLLAGPPPRHAAVHPGRGSHLVRLEWAEVDVNLVVSARLDPQDPDNLSQPLMAFTISHADGEMHLDHPHGVLRWLPRPHVVDGRPVREDDPTEVLLDTRPEPTHGQVIDEQWPPAIHRALVDLFEGTDVQLPRHLAVLRLWTSISAQLPPATPVRAEAPTCRVGLLKEVR